ncbi:MAG: hypothetical protein JW774_04125 [Candidatus Aureabacteria bacterium]|nr:hypothetical protein [Candidatus Auribacterota bacterium]
MKIIGAIYSRSIFLLSLLLPMSTGYFLSFAAEVSTPIEVEATVSPCVIHIGDIIHYRVKIKASPLLKVEFPDLGVNLTLFSVRNISPKKETMEKDHKVVEQSYEINTFLTGDYIIPPFIIHYGKDKPDQVILSGALYVRVETRLNEASNDIRDIQPPVVFPASEKINNILLWSVIPAGLLIIVLGWYWRSRARGNPEKILSPWENALVKLDELSASSTIEKNNFREYYYRLSDILRHYIEDRFDLMAPERTTEEFIKLMQTRPEFLSSHQQLLKQFLHECDWVKFAKGNPDPVQAQEGIQTVRTFIRETIPQAAGDLKKE